MVRNKNELRAGPKGKMGRWASRSTHGMSRTPLYRQWAAMVQRGSNPKLNCAAYYVGRGITVCDEWRKFDAFYADMGESWQPGLTLDRIDNNKGYEPGNCTWKTQKEQMRNTRRAVMVDTKWGLIHISEAAERSGIHRNTLRARLLAGTELFR